MSSLHISRVDDVSPWKPVPAAADNMLLTDCCHCRVPARACRFRKLTSHGGYVVTQQVHCKRQDATPTHGDALEWICDQVHNGKSNRSPAPVAPSEIPR